MPNVFRFRHSNPPEPNRNSTAVFADDDGTLKQVAPNGDVTEIGSGGGGGITEITSDDESVTVMGGSGPTVDLSVVPAGASVPFVGADPPADPSDGELWWDTDDDTAVAATLADVLAAGSDADGQDATGFGAVDGAALGASFVYVSVQSDPPGSEYISPLVVDDSPGTGGGYAWDGSQYVQVSAI